MPLQSRTGLPNRSKYRLWKKHLYAGLAPVRQAEVVEDRHNPPRVTALVAHPCFRGDQLS
jgi:hypothetical protein